MWKGGEWQEQNTKKKGCKKILVGLRLDYADNEFKQLLSSCIILHQFAKALSVQYPFALSRTGSDSLRRKLFPQVRIGLCHFTDDGIASLAPRVGKRIALEHSEKHHFGTQPFLDRIALEHKMLRHFRPQPTNKTSNLLTGTALWKACAFQSGHLGFFLGRNIFQRSFPLRALFRVYLGG
jgi:hypothetical protein